MADFPRSLQEFQERFPHADACAAYLAEQRWPDGFVCPHCGHGKGWRLATKPWTYECGGCRRQTSVTAGTVMHGSKLSLTTWFWAAYLMASHSNGISALQLQNQLGIGAYRSAWLMAHKLRRAMRDPDRSELAGVVEVDETSLPQRTKQEPPAGGRGRSHQGKMLVAGAIEVVDGRPGRVRLEHIKDYSADTLHGVLNRNLTPGTTAQTDAWAAYPGAPGVIHQPYTIGPMAAHIVLPWIHRVFANLKAWSVGVYHGLRRRHLQAYLDEFVFRFNRRYSRHAAFRRLLGLGAKVEPITYNMLVKPEAGA